MIIHKWVISIISHSSLFKKHQKIFCWNITRLTSRVLPWAPALDVVEVHLRCKAPHRRNSRDLRDLLRSHVRR